MNREFVFLVVVLRVSRVLFSEGPNSLISFIYSNYLKKRKQDSKGTKLTFIYKISYNSSNPTVSL